MTIPRPTRPTRGALASLQGLRALHHRNYRLFFSGQLISLIGTWMTAVAQSWLILQLTGNPFDLGLMTVAQFGPVLVLGLFGGLIADGLPKRRTLYVTQIVAMGVSFALFVLAATHTVTVWEVWALAAVMGVRNAVDMPTRQAFAVEMVGREDVGNAVALNSAMFNGARILGPAIAGLTIGAFGVSIAFLIDAISFLAVLLGLFLMRVEDLHPAPRFARLTTVREVGSNLADGLRYVRRTGIVFLAITVVGVVATFGINFTILVPPLAALNLRVGASGYGFLMAASGVGSLLAALAIAFGGTSPTRMLAGGLVLGVAELFIGIGTYPADLLLMFIAGAGAITMMATANTILQLAVPDELRGRVMSVYTTVFAGTNPIGGLLLGAIAANAGAPAAIALGGAVSLVAVGGGVVWYRRLGRPDPRVNPIARVAAVTVVPPGVAAVAGVPPGVAAVAVVPVAPVAPVVPGAASIATTAGGVDR
ncbi:MAG: MFS transporter [Candidatus Limnocylindrales bacterium]